MNGPQEAPGPGQAEQSAGSKPAALGLGRSVKWFATDDEWSLILGLLLWFIGLITGAVIMLLADRLGWGLAW